ncbi:hypothetical protein PDE_08287 [Penicillium oxalicum 114-2]|uniref:Uncharacterized protein n=1 Tax=Penicillium oxalicum (strain 114-2 / CGMCC 5302) TaxID=933388 RepID=S7ZRJ8_PENO1|nr:hypothetical protein PDE_08287 [Penicillium oxalicum 114-2]
MAPTQVLLSNLNPTNTESFRIQVQEFIPDRSVILSFFQRVFSQCREAVGHAAERISHSDLIPRVIAFFQEWASQTIEWLSQPDVIAVVIAWSIAFTVALKFLAKAALALLATLGFGSVGIISGSLAAAFQALAYGAFTPAQSLFAALTSIAMVGGLPPALVIVGAVIIATVIAMIVWYARWWGA